jgi:hypothetical protein
VPIVGYKRGVERVRAVPGWALAMFVIGLVVLALSPVPGWLIHHRELQGEGYRTLTVGLTAWQLRSGSLPVVGGAVVVSAALGIVAVSMPGARRWLPVGAALALGLLVAGLAPLAQEGHISRINISPGWALFVGIALAAAMLGLALRGGGHPSRGLLAGAAVTLLVASAGGYSVRAVQLDLFEGPSVHWSDGEHRRADGAHELVLTLRDGTYQLGRWAGTMEAAGINVILTEDPACPESRAMYRVRAVSDGTLWERVVDLCADGERAAELEGVWVPAPAD